MKVKFVPQNIEVEVGPEKTLLQVATENHIEIKSICKGVPSCAECRVRIVEGEHNVLPPNKTELSLIGTNWYIDGRRLSCQVRCYGNVTVDLTEQIERQENQTKKVRGFRSQKQTQSQAVQDTMLLVEKPEENTQPERPQERERPPQQERQQQRQGGRGQGGGGQQQQPRQQNQQKNQNQNRQQQQPRQQAKPQGQGGSGGQQGNRNGNQGGGNRGNSGGGGRQQQPQGSGGQSQSGNTNTPTVPKKP